MRTDVINAVARAIEGQELRHCDFNIEVYASEDRARQINGSKWVADIAGYTAALFQRNGVRRPRPLGFDEVAEIAHCENMIDYVRSAMAIHEIDAELLVAPHIIIDAVKLGAQNFPAALAVDVLRNFAATGRVEWGEIKRIAA